MGYVRSLASDKAVELIASGLSSGSIKLLGTNGAIDATSAGKQDAEYLVTLFTSLRDGMADREQSRSY